eukprot:s1324_g10.t1
MSSGEGAVFADFDGLAVLWDNMKVVRDRLSDHHAMMLEKPPPGEPLAAAPGTIAKNHSNLRFNAEILMPLMVKMREHRDKFPDVNALAQQVKECFESSRLNPSSVTLSDEAWSLRYMYNLVKQLTYKKKPPRETCFEVSFFGGGDVGKN